MGHCADEMYIVHCFKCQKEHQVVGEDGCCAAGFLFVLRSHMLSSNKTELQNHGSQKILNFSALLIASAPLLRWAALLYYSST